MKVGSGVRCPMGAVAAVMNWKSSAFIFVLSIQSLAQQHSPKDSPSLSETIAVDESDIQ